MDIYSPPKGVYPSLEPWSAGNLSAHGEVDTSIPAQAGLETANGKQELLRFFNKNRHTVPLPARSFRAHGESPRVRYDAACYASVLPRLHALLLFVHTGRLTCSPRSAAGRYAGFPGKQEANCWPLFSAAPRAEGALQDLYCRTAPLAISPPHTPTSCTWTTLQMYPMMGEGNQWGHSPRLQANTLLSGGGMREIFPSAYSRRPGCQREGRNADSSTCHQRKSERTGS